MSIPSTLTFTDHAAAIAQPERYISINIDIDAILKSWKSSLYSFEWLGPDGSIKPIEDLSASDQEKRKAFEAQLKSGTPIEKPVLGIGLLENVEIGSGKVTLLTLAALGLKSMPVHIPASSAKEFKRYISAAASQSGNILIYILIAVALLAALSYAVTQSSRTGSGSISDDRARLLATEIIEVSSSMATAVQQMRLRGVRDQDLCFNHPQWGGSYLNASCSDAQNKFFDPEGGGINWAEAPRDAMDAAASPDYLWHFYTDNEIQDVGSTAGAAASSDLILITDELSQSVCEKINDLLGITPPATTPPADTNYGTEMFSGAFSYTATIGDEDAALAGKNAACFLNTTSGKYAFYRVLVTR